MIKIKVAYCHLLVTNLCVTNNMLITVSFFKFLHRIREKKSMKFCGIKKKSEIKSGSRLIMTRCWTTNSVTKHERPLASSTTLFMPWKKMWRFHGIYERKISRNTSWKHSLLCCVILIASSYMSIPLWVTNRECTAFEYMEAE